MVGVLYDWFGHYARAFVSAISANILNVATACTHQRADVGLWGRGRNFLPRCDARHTKAKGNSATATSRLPHRPAVAVAIQSRTARSDWYASGGYRATNYVWRRYFLAGYSPT